MKYQSFICLSLFLGSGTGLVSENGRTNPLISVSAHSSSASQTQKIAVPETKPTQPKAERFPPKEDPHLNQLKQVLANWSGIRSNINLTLQDPNSSSYTKNSSKMAIQMIDNVLAQIQKSMSLLPEKLILEQWTEKLPYDINFTEEYDRSKNSRGRTKTENENRHEKPCVDSRSRN